MSPKAGTKKNLASKGLLGLFELLPVREKFCTLFSTDGQRMVFSAFILPSPVVTGQSLLHASLRDHSGIHEGKMIGQDNQGIVISQSFHFSTINFFQFFYVDIKQTGLDETIRC